MLLVIYLTINSNSSKSIDHFIVPAELLQAQLVIRSAVKALNEERLRDYRSMITLFVIEIIRHNLQWTILLNPECWIYVLRIN
jgi:hypothetical protein